MRLTSNANTVGGRALERVAADWQTIKPELGGTARCDQMSPKRFRFEDFLTIDREAGPEEQQRAVEWMRERLDTFKMVFRPRIKAAVADLTTE